MQCNGRDIMINFGITSSWHGELRGIIKHSNTEKLKQFQSKLIQGASKIDILQFRIFPCVLLQLFQTLKQDEVLLYRNSLEVPI